MKLPNSLLAGVGGLLIGVAPLLHAAPGPDDQRQDHGPQYQQQAPQERHEPSGPQGNRDGGRPPQDFGPVRQTIQDHRESFARGTPPPPNLHIERGRPLPQGYGRRLDARALQHLPRYDGYEWRRVGTDVVLVAISTGLVYEILDNVLN